MNNKKGFTIIEVVLSFTFAIIILASMFAIVINYQNKTEKEKIISSLLTYKNSVLEIVYQDVIGNNIDSMRSCGSKCIEIKTADDTYKLEGKVDGDGTNYITYRGNNYVLPDSNFNLSKINDFEYQFDEENEIFRVDIPLVHAELDDSENDENTIEIVISGKEFEKPVNKLDNPTVVSPIDGIIYDGNNHNLVSINKLKGTIYFSLSKLLTSDNYTDGSNNISTGLKAGTYNVYYYVLGNDDYLSKGGTVSVTIDKRLVTYKADDASKNYDGNPLTKKTATLISGSLVSGHTASFTINGSITDVGTKDNVLDKVIIKDSSGNDVSNNYSITKVNGTLEIVLPCGWVDTSSYTVSSCSPKSQTSNPKSGDTYVTCDGPYGTGKWRFSLASYTCGDGSSAGGYSSGYNMSSAQDAETSCSNTAVTTCTTRGGSGNFNSSMCTSKQDRYYVKKTYTYECSLNLNANPITITANSLTYTGSAQSLVKTQNAQGTVYYSTTKELTSSNYASGSTSIPTGTNAGTYTVYYYVVGNNSYNAKSGSVEVVIGKKSTTISLTEKTVNYNGNQVVASATATSGASVNFIYYSNNSCTTKTTTAMSGGSSTGLAPKLVGTYYVTATSIENTNYSAGSLSCTKAVTINDQIYTITLNNQSATTAGTTKIYEKLGNGIYLDSNYTNKMTTTSNPITKPTKTGYTFGGYYTSANGGGTQLINANGNITSAVTNTYFNSNTTLYAKWNANTYTITLNSTDGVIPTTSGWNISGETATKNYSYGNTFGTLPTPTKEGYAFSGWYTAESGGTKITSTTAIPSANTTYYAQWTAKPIRVYYNVNGGNVTSSTAGGTYSKDSSGFVTRDGTLISTTVNYGGQLGSSGFENYNNTSYMNITKTGYTGRANTPWNSNANGSGTKYSQSTVYTYNQLLSDPNISELDTYMRLNLYVDWIKLLSNNDITVTLGTTTYTYDGTAKKPTVTVKDGNKTLTSGTDYTVSYTNNTNAGTATVTITGTGNYTGTITTTFTINKRAVTYTADSATQEFNGTALTAPSASLTSGTLASGHTATFVVSGSLIDVGSSTNTLNSVTITDSSGNDVSNNYDITKKNGTLTVKQSITCSISVSGTNLTVNVNGGSSSYSYSWTDTNGTVRGTENVLAVSNAPIGNNFSVSVKVTDLLSGSIANCTTACSFSSWNSRTSFFSSTNQSYSKTAAENANSNWYRNCNSGVLPTVCVQNGLSASGCYSCTEYSRGLTCN